MYKFQSLRKSRWLLLMLLALFVGANPVCADELTVYDGTETSTYVPVAGYYADTNNQIVEIIYPASALSGMSGGTISMMKFYLSASASAAWGATYEVFVKEVDRDAFEVSSSYYSSTATAIGKDGATTVYTGKLDATGSTMDISFDENLEYNGGNLLVGIYMTSAGNNYPSATFYGSESANGSWCRYSSNSGNKPQNFIPKTTFTYTSATPGPKLAVKDGSKKITSPYAYDFGLTTAGTTHTFTLTNPGTAAVEGLSVSETGSFGATLSATSIAAGGEATLTITMPAATGNSAITISSTTEDIADFVINASGTVRDPNKVYIDFSNGEIPEGWSSVAIGSYASSYGSPWSASTGYVSQSGSSSSYEWAFTSPKLTFTEGEQVFFETQKYSSSSLYNPSIKVQYSTDGSSWTTIGSAFTDDTYTDWTSRSVTIPTADAKYIRFSGWYIKLRNIYGGQLPIEPKMVVTQPASLDYGIISEATAKTFTIANTGLATLEGISVTSSDAAFTVTGAPTSLAAGESQEVTITMAATTEGALSSDITVSATGMEDVVFTVTGVVMPAGAMTVDFNDNALPSGWSAPSWSFSNGYAATSGNSTIYMTTPKLAFAADGFFAFKVRASDSGSGDYVTVQTSTDAGTNWSDIKTFSYNNGDFGSSSSEFKTVVVSGISSSVNKIRFKGYYVHIDDITGLTYAPVLNVTTGDPAETVSTPAAYDFGECAANASVTYNFANTGAGTINITGVAITGDGAAAYSTNWTESVSAPFALTITRTYDAARAGSGAQDAVVTVTTSDGVFVINVTGTDKAANAPELAVSTNAIDFGKQTADAVETVTVTNNGTGSMEVNIASDSEDFVVSAASLTEIGAGESKTFDVTFKYGTSYGVKNGNITVTPTYNTEAAQTITATAKAMDPELWSEDFEGGEIHAGWENSGFTVGTSSNGYSLSSTMAVSTYSSSNSTLVTPLLVATAGDKLTFDAFLYWGDDAVKVEYSTDGTDWNTESPLLNFKGSSSTDAKAIRNMEIEAPITGEFYLRFTTCYGNAIDNIEGFKLAPKKEHEATIASSSIPASGNQYVEYTATVTVKEKAGKDDEVVTAELWIGTTKVATESDVTLTANDDKEISLTFTPDAAMSGDAYIKVYNGDLDLTTATQAVTIAAATVLDETVGLPDGLTIGTKPSVVVKYTAKDGWNTIAVPFALTDEILTEIFGEGYQIYEFKRYVESKSIIGFDTPTSFYAGYPYLVYVETAAKHDDGVILKDLNISTTSANYDSHNGVTFQTTYAPIAAPGMKGLYGVTSAGKIQPGSDKASLKGFRAYFSGLPAASAAQFMLTVDGETVITGIDGITREAQEKLDGSTIYNLKGQKVTVPAKGGLYIINGKKTILK